MSNTPSAAFSDTKAHYDLLDGLRGVAALMVIWYHIFEGYAFASDTMITTFNHGYLAVDFFFILSGFVIGYAYDDRWGKSLTMKDFFKRRLIRLHPMVIMGAVLGAITFCFQGSVQWDGTHIGISMIMLSLLCTIFFIPAMPGVGYEVRGNGEMFPLNGPCWSLFFEYIGNILYALFIRRLSNKALTVLVVLLGVALALFAVFDVSGYGNIGVGWTLNGVNFGGGLLRMSFTVPGIESVIAEKMGERVDLMDVVEKGNRQMHGIDRYVDLITSGETIRISSKEAFLLNVGEAQGLNYSTNYPDKRKGAHFNLNNNLWGTNFSMWNEGSLTYHFVIETLNRK